MRLVQVRTQCHMFECILSILNCLGGFETFTLYIIMSASDSSGVGSVSSIPLIGSTSQAVCNVTFLLWKKNSDLRGYLQEASAGHKLSQQ